MGRLKLSERFPYKISIPRPGKVYNYQFITDVKNTLSAEIGIQFIEWDYINWIDHFDFYFKNADDAVKFKLIFG